MADPVTQPTELSDAALDEVAGGDKPAESGLGNTTAADAGGNLAGGHGQGRDHQGFGPAPGSGIFK